MTPPAPAVDVLGSLALATPRGRTVTVDGRGRSVLVRVPLGVLSERGGPRPRRSAATLSSAAQRLGVTVDVHLGGLVRARFAPRLRAGLASRLLGWAPFRIALFPA